MDNLRQKARPYVLGGIAVCLIGALVYKSVFPNKHKVIPLKDVLVTAIFHKDTSQMEWVDDILQEVADKLQPVPGDSEKNEYRVDTMYGYGVVDTTKIRINGKDSVVKRQRIIRIPKSWVRCWHVKGYYRH